MTYVTKQPSGIMTTKLWGIFLDAKNEEIYFKKKFNSKFLLFFINFTSLIYSIVNLVISIIDEELNKDFLTLISLTILILNFIILSCSMFVY
jgi:hypothetical protein